MNPLLPIAAGGFTEFLLGFLLFFISLFMIFIILIQRGKGGGLAGALTGTAQSAFGAKAGDTMTRVTLIVSIIWILLISITIKAMNKSDTPDLSNAGNDANPRTNIRIESDSTDDSDNTGVLDLNPSTTSDDNASTDDNLIESDDDETGSEDVSETTSTDETSEDSGDSSDEQSSVDDESKENAVDDNDADDTATDDTTADE